MAAEKQASTHITRCGARYVGLAAGVVALAATRLGQACGKAAKNAGALLAEYARKRRQQVAPPVVWPCPSESGEGAEAPQRAVEPSVYRQGQTEAPLEGQPPAMSEDTGMAPTDTASLGGETGTGVPC